MNDKPQVCEHGNAPSALGDWPPCCLVDVTLSGQTYVVLSGGGFFQTERQDIGNAFRGRRIGFGHQYRATLGLPDARALLRSGLAGYSWWRDTGGVDDGGETHRDGWAIYRDGVKLAKQLGITWDWENHGAWEAHGL